MRKVLYRAAVVLALTAATVTGVTTSSASAAPTHHLYADGPSPTITYPATLAPNDWWW
jgi:hypothetical protein